MEGTEEKRGNLTVKRKGIEGKVRVTGKGEGVRRRPKSKSKYSLELTKRVIIPIRRCK